MMGTIGTLHAERATKVTKSRIKDHSLRFMNQEKSIAAAVASPKGKGTATHKVSGRATPLGLGIYGHRIPGIRPAAFIP
jgi:hypothetical protein